MGIDEKRRIWEAEQAQMILPIDDDIAKLADEIYEDMVTTKVARKKGERQGGALAGLGFEAWLGPWGAYTDPDTDLARQRILNSLRHKPYFSTLAMFGLVGHPQRKVELRAEWLKPYCRIEGNDELHWGLEDTRERAELFQSKYDHVELLVIDDGDVTELVINKIRSTDFDNVNSLYELGLDDDDYRFQVGARNNDWGYTGRWFDYARVKGVWQLLPYQVQDWDNEYRGEQ